MNADLNLYIASLDGQLQGFFETASPYQFSVQGSLGVCIDDIGCINGEGAASTVGASGCVVVATIPYWEPEEDSDWHWYTPWRVHWVEEETQLMAGFGYDWGGSVSLWASSCDIGDYELAQPAAADPHSFLVSQARYPVAVKIAGSDGAPRVRITTPSGRVISPPAKGRIGEKIKGVGMLLENQKLDETMLLLTSPQKGAWRVTPVSGSVPVTRIETARSLAPPVVLGGVRLSTGGKVGVGLAYAIAVGEKLTLYASGPDHSVQLIGVAKGKACQDQGASGPSERDCWSTSFTPVYGPSGRRTITGVITNAGGLPVRTVTVGSVKVSFPAPKAAKPSLGRVGGGAAAQWTAVPYAAHYAIGIETTDGRKLSLTTTALHVTIPAITKQTGVTVTIWPVMENGVIGQSASASLQAEALCQTASGSLRGITLGQITLGMPKRQVDEIYPEFNVTPYGTYRFCVAGGETRVGYPSDAYLKTLPRALSATVSGRVVWALTTNPRYTLDGIAANMKLATVRGKIQLGEPVKIGTTAWYLVSSAHAAGVIRVHNGVVSAIAIADKRLVASDRSLRKLLRGFKYGAA
jgi:hypothetical protein